MDVRYGELPLDLLRSLFTFEELLKLFLDLVTRLGGDVGEALDVMRRLQERGILDPNLDLDAFVAALEEKGIVGRDGEGGLALAAAGERQIRRAAFEEIFSSLQKSGSGLHALPRAGTGTELLEETRPWEFGDDLSRLDGVRTVTNAARRDPETLWWDAAGIASAQITGQLKLRVTFGLTDGSALAIAGTVETALVDSAEAFGEAVGYLGAPKAG